MSLPAALPTGEKPARPVAWTRWAVGLVLAVFAVSYLSIFITKSYAETELYIRAAERMLHGEPIHRVDERAFSYPPLFALVFVPLALLPQALHRPIWYVVNLALLALIFSRLARLLSHGLRKTATPSGDACVSPTVNYPFPATSSRSQWRIGKLLSNRWLFWGLVLALSGRHLLAVLENQSHDFVVLLCVVLATEAWCGGRGIAAGFWAGLGAAFKATPLLFAPFLLWQRQWKGCAVLLATLAAFLFLPDLLLPANDGVSWTVSWYRTFLTGVGPGSSPEVQNTWYAGTKLNQSVAGTIHRLVTPRLPDDPDEEVCLVALSAPVRKILTLLAQFAVGAWLMSVTRPALARQLPRAESAFLRLGQGAAIATAMVLLSPTSIKTHFGVLLLPVAFCLADFLYRRRDPVVGTALAMTFVLGSLTVKDFLGVELGGLVLSYGSVTALTLSLYLATGRILLQRSCPHQAPQETTPQPLPDWRDNCQRQFSRRVKVGTLPALTSSTNRRISSPPPPGHTNSPRA